MKAGRKGGRDTRFKRGHDPKRNVTKPGPGRPSNDFYAQAAGAADRGMAAIDAYIADNCDPEDPVFRWCFSEAAKFSRSQAPLRSELENVTPAAVPRAAFIVTEEDGAVSHYVEIHRPEELESLKSQAIRALIEQGARVYLQDSPAEGGVPQPVTIATPRPTGAA
jgi:hypothetical protein